MKKGRQEATSYGMSNTIRPPLGNETATAAIRGRVVFVVVPRTLALRGPLFTSHTHKSTRQAWLIQNICDECCRGYVRLAGPLSLLR